MAKILKITPVSVTVEIDNDKPYLTDAFYAVFLNGKVVKKAVNVNVFSLFNLEPNSVYSINIFSEKGEEISLDFSTPSVSETVALNLESGIDQKDAIQKAIDSLKENGLIKLSGKNIIASPLKLKSYMTLEFVNDSSLIFDPVISHYPIVDGTFEGVRRLMYASLFTIEDAVGVNLVGDVTLDGNSEKAGWWSNPKDILKPARPRFIFISHASDVALVGLTLKNSPSWTIHPYYASDIDILNCHIINPENSPNTDGCDPDSSTKVRIIGSTFDCGDDCIAIKSGKRETALIACQPSSNIVIQNCEMLNGHGAVVLGSENSSGIKDLIVNRCIFKNTDRGIRVKTRRGRGDKAILDGFHFSNLVMDGVKTCFVINAFYNADVDGHSPYVQNKNFTKVDERTPYLGSFTFENIEARMTKACAGFFYGLPEKPIVSLRFINVHISFDLNASPSLPAMMDDILPVKRSGFYFHNVQVVSLKNVTLDGILGDEVMTVNVTEMIRQ